MASGYNKVILIGNLTNQPELKQTAGGTEVCNFSIAVNRRFAKQGEQSVDYINIVAFKHNANFVATYMGKGSQILVSGQIQTRSYNNSQGQKVYVTEVVADEVMAFGKSNAQNAPSNAPRVSVPNQGNKNYVPDAYGGMPSGFEAIEIPNDESLPFD